MFNSRFKKAAVMTAAAAALAVTASACTPLGIGGREGWLLTSVQGSAVPMGLRIDSGGTRVVSCAVANGPKSSPCYVKRLDRAPNGRITGALVVGAYNGDWVTVYVR